jgi:hypothetical protein
MTTAFLFERSAFVGVFLGYRRKQHTIAIRRNSKRQASAINRGCFDTNLVRK